MDARNDVESNDCEKFVNKKRARKVASYLSAGKRVGAHWQNCKRIRTDELGVASRSEGVVRYNCFASDAYGWLTVDAFNFRKSGIPSRFMFYDNAEWKDFSKNSTSILSDHFRAGKKVTELSVEGRDYLVNFLLMMQWNQSTGFLRSIAWIDEHGKCFFPSKLFEGHAARLQEGIDHQFRLKLDIQDMGSQICRTHQCTDAYDPGRSTCKNDDGVYQHGMFEGCMTSQKIKGGLGSALEISSYLKVGGEACAKNVAATKRVSRDFTLLGDRLIKLEQGDQEYAIVKNKFLAGLGMLVTYTSIVGIYRDTHSSTSGQGRFQAFQKQEEMKRKLRGDANVRYAWHGTSKQGVSGIVLHGFGQPKTPKNGTAYGVGVYLAPEDYSHVSAIYSDVDENGEQHMVLCRVIMGNMEQVQPGSEQFHPSSEEYDTGVDDCLNPKRYIIWSTHMNTHILLQYILSFKIAPQWHDIMAVLRGKQMISRGMPSGNMSQHRQDGNAGFECCLCQGSESKAGGSVCQVAKCTSTEQCSNRVPRSPWMSFPMLFYILRSKLAPPCVITLQQHYAEFKAGRMPREVLIRNVRAIAGDRILTDSIKSLQAQEKTSHSLKALELHPSPVAVPVLESDDDSHGDLLSSSDRAVLDPRL